MMLIKKNKNIYKKVLKGAGHIIAALSVLFVLIAVYRLGFDFSSVRSIPQFVLILIIASSVIGVTVYMLGAAWKNWLDFFSGKKISMRETVCVYAKANIGKYLPGNVMHYVERNLFAGKIGISQTKLAACSILEMIGQAGIAVLFGLIFSFRELRSVLTQLVDPMVVLGILGGVLIVAAVAFAIFHKKILELLKTYGTWALFFTVVKSLAVYAGVLMISGLLLVAVYKYMYGDVTLEYVSLIVSGYIIAWVLGFVIPGAPGGIGVREFVLMALLSPALGDEATLSISVVHRLITIVGDFMAYIAEKIIHLAGRNNR